jgi:DNA-binding NarL/FixJ family response regulator
MENRATALIIAGSAQLRDSLLVLLRALPQIETVCQAEDAPSALAMAPQVQPVLVLLDCDPAEDNLRPALDQIRATWPGARCLILIEDDEDRRCLRGGGADVTLVKGLRAATVLETIEGLLSADDPALRPCLMEKDKDGTPHDF